MLMKTILIALVLLILSALLFFLAPHHRRRENSFKDCTLGEIYGKLFRDEPEIFSPELISPRIIVFLMLACTGIAAAFFPAIFALLAHWLSPPLGQAGGAVFVLGGLLAAAGVFANFVAIIASHLSFGFGSSSSGDETPFLWIIPLFQLLFALASIAIGSSAHVADWTIRLLGR
jgi:MFS family permease